MSIEQFANGASTTLASSINNSVTSLSVSSASEFPSSGNFRILIDTEILLVTAVSGTTFTITRGTESTTAASHSSSAPVTHILTSGALSAFRGDTISSDIIANLPSASVNGRIYLPTDAPYLYRDNGSAWSAFGPLWPMTPVDTSGFASGNLGATGTLTTSNGIVNLSDSGGQGGSDAWRLYTKTIPTAPYTITIGFICFLYPGSTGAAVALILYDGTKLVTFVVGLTSSDWRTAVFKYNTVSSFNGTYVNLLQKGSTPPGLIWMRVDDDGANRTFSISMDGFNFNQIHQVGNTDFLTPTKVGIAIDNVGSSSGQICSMSILSWKG